MDPNKIVNFIQLHIEKIVLGVCALILLIIILSMLFGQSYAIRMAGKTVAPADVPKIVKEDAQKLKQKLETSNSDIKAKPVPSYVDAFREQASKPAIAYANKKLAPLGTIGLVSSISDVSYKTYLLPKVPVTTNPIAKAGYGALGSIQDANENQKTLAVIQDNKSPYDFRYVTVGATFNLSKWKKNYDALSPKQRPPQNWFSSDIAGVYLQRETWNDKAGKWSKAKVIAPIPTQIGFTDAQQNWNTQETEDNLKLIKSHQQEIMQPRFVPLANGGIWQRPYITHSLLSDRDQLQLKSLRHDIDTLKNQQDKLYERIAAIKKRFSQVEGSQGDDNKSSGKNSAVDRATAVVQKRLQQIQSRLYRDLYTRSNLLMRPAPPSPPGWPFSTGRNGKAQAPSWLDTLKQQRDRSQPTPPEKKLKDGQVRVWAYDLTAKPGKKYRYRVIVAMVNPLFNKGTVANKQRQENMKKIALAPGKQELQKYGKGSWVTVETAPQYYFFFLSGSAKNQTARIEVWQIYNGIWRNSAFVQRPGDTIGKEAQVKMETGAVKFVNMNTDNLLVDIVSGGNDSSNLQLLYLNKRTNQLEQRLLQNDRNSLMRTSLENQQAIGKHQTKIFYGSNGKPMPYASPEQRKGVNNQQSQSLSPEPGDIPQ